MKVDAIYVSPVKSLGMTRLERAEVTPRGLAGDRAFYIVDERGRVVTQRECPHMVQARAEYDVESERLRIILPDGGRSPEAPAATLLPDPQREGALR